MAETWAVGKFPSEIQTAIALKAPSCMHSSLYPLKLLEEVVNRNVIREMTFARQLRPFSW